MAGKKSIHGPAKGLGWGGPPKGASADRGDKAATFEDGNAAGAVPDADRDFSVYKRLESLKTRLYDIGMAGSAGDATSVQVQAAVAYMNREEGMPVAKQEHVVTQISMTNEQRDTARRNFAKRVASQD